MPFRTELSSGLHRRLAMIKEHCLNHRHWFNPFTATACEISGLKAARTRLQTVLFSDPITHLLSMLCVLINPFNMPERNRRKKKGWGVSNFALFLVVFKWHRDSEGVKQGFIYFIYCVHHRSWSRADGQTDRRQMDAGEGEAVQTGAHQQLHLD